MHSYVQAELQALKHRADEADTSTGMEAGEEVDSPYKKEEEKDGGAATGQLGKAKRAAEVEEGEKDEEVKTGESDGKRTGKENHRLKSLGNDVEHLKRRLKKATGEEAPPVVLTSISRSSSDTRKAFRDWADAASSQVEGAKAKARAKKEASSSSSRRSGGKRYCSGVTPSVIVF